MGKRIEKYFDTLPEARNWLADARYEDMHSGLGPTSTMTVDSWFNYWFDNIICDLSPNTRRNYKERYERNIQPVIGRMCMVDVKPMHCKIILNRMMAVYAGSTIRQAYIAMGTMFRAAVMNDVISKHPAADRGIDWPDLGRYRLGGPDADREQDVGVPPQSAHLESWPAQDPDQLSDHPTDQPGVQHPLGDL